MKLSYEKCLLCARGCGVNRTLGELGYCRATNNATVARAALHMWEEPIISGPAGSGAIFFSGCSLGCVFCQNAEISRTAVGKEVSAQRLAEIMLELQDKGAHNINFVTPTHYALTVKEAVLIAKNRGLTLPTVYNTSSYDTPDTLRELEGIIDIYLPDFKYYLSKTAKRYSFAESYPRVAKNAIAEMVRQRPVPLIKDGIMLSGVIVRLLLLPGCVAEAKLILKYLHDTYGDSIYLSLMNQYTPTKKLTPPLDRRVTRAEYRDFVSYAERLGVKNAFVQENGAADEIFIPTFDNTGV